MDATSTSVHFTARIGWIELATSSRTCPAPPRTAALAHRYGAPVNVLLPATTATRPNVPLCPSRGRAGTATGAGGSSSAPEPAIDGLP